MAIIYGLVLVATLLAGGAGGWLITTGHYERIAAEHEQEEEELAEFQDLYAAWAILHRML
jgi:membrane protein YqaA with SNARE-associated domain